MTKYIKKQPLSATVILLIWVVCMMPVPETPLNDISMIDKWTHLVMYGVLTLVVMLEYACHHNGITWHRFLVGAMLMPMLMGGLVELAQAYLTFGIRSGDWFDFLANSLGVMLGSVIGIPLAMCLAKRRKEK